MKRIISLSIFLLITTLSFAATRYWVGGGTNSNWNSSPTTNWSATDGGANGASVPGAGDDVIFNGNGATANTASTISATITVLSLTFTAGYTNTVTVNAVPTIAGNFTDNTAHSWAGSSNMTISAASTITSGGKTWPNGVTFSNTNTKTLSGNWTISGTLTISGATTLNWTTNETLSCAGISCNNTCAGTAKIILTGGSWSNASGFDFSNSMDIAGNVTITSSQSQTYKTGTLTYVSGTVTTTGSTILITGTCTLNTNGINFNNITVFTSSTITLNSLLTVNGVLTINGGITATFAGSSGFTVATFTVSNVSAASQTFNDGVTYTITTALNAFNSRTGSILTFTSDDATNKAIITLQQGATCNVLANFTRIDASGGRTIRTFNGTVTSCTNVVAFNDIGTSKH